MPFPTSPTSSEQSLDQARKSLEAGEFFHAREMTQKVLEEKPQDLEAEKLMAEIRCFIATGDTE